MLYPEDLGVALKEWDSVCQALIQGRQIVLLRKGGIHESGGEFELEFRRFFLFPTFLHQDQTMLKDSAQDLFSYSGSEPSTIQISAFADVTDIVPIETIDQITAIDAHHVWTPKLLQTRMNYRPENPLYLLLAKVQKLPQPVTIENHQSYAGCKSWVGLRKTINVKGSTLVLDPPTYQQQRDEVMIRVKTAPKPADE
jgi:hypothetical protein